MLRFIFASGTLVASLLLLACGASARGETLQIKVSAGKHDRVNTPVRVVIELPEAQQDAKSAEILTPDGARIFGQITPPSLLSPSTGDGQQRKRELNFVLPELKAGESMSCEVHIPQRVRIMLPQFAWKNTEGHYADLSFAGRPVLRYMYRAYDPSTSASKDETIKIFHHVFDPTGKQLLTKGHGGLYTHHRGLFFGFNKVSYDGKSCDIWHCRQGEHQSHRDFLLEEAGPVLGRHLLAVDWHGGMGDLFAREQRELTAYNVPNATLIDFASRVSTIGAPIELDGDPQHAGFHFRAAQEVAADTKGETYYLRPDGIDSKGRTRNWPQQRDQVNLPWKGMSVTIGGKRYTVAYLDRPQNPKESRFSERDYGRFGSYFEYKITPDRPLEVAYRVWIQEGEMSQEDIARLDADFIDPVTVEVQR